MIVKMKQITLLCQTRDKESTLEELRDIGVLHLVPVQEPQGDDVNDVRQELERAKAASSALDLYAHEHHGLQHSHDHEAVSAAETVEKVSQLLQHGKELEDHREVLHHDISLLEPFGDFDPGLLHSLAEKGIYVRLFSASPKHPIEVPDDASVHILTSDTEGIHFAVTATSEFEMDAHEPPLPEKSLGVLLEDLENVKRELQAVESQLCDLSSEYKAVTGYEHELEERQAFVKARGGMGHDRAISYLQGFCPEDRVDDLRTVLDRHGWGLVVEEPLDASAVPTLVRYPRFVKPIKAIFDVLQILPGYHEADISSLFLIFFSIFFAILIGDAGYGLLFLGLTAFMRKKKPDAPSYPFTLFYILSTCTIMWGVLTNNYFGIKPEFLPEVLRNLRMPWLTDGVIESRNHIMKLSFFIGACHLTIAHIWNSIVIYPNKKWIAQFGWITLVWTMYFAACAMVVGDPFPGFAYAMLAVSVLLILLFMSSSEEFKQEKIEHIMFPLALVSCFVDVISYIRLFAVGMASLSVAQSFNDMAMRLDFSKVWTIPFIALILAAGHGLNILLCVLGILVHGVRLNTLEFSTHKEQEWSGRKYNPFKRSETTNT
jgi:V/A-type H+-transporting ATPase subunit I